MHLTEYDELPPPPPPQPNQQNLLLPKHEGLDDNISEEGKLLACVCDDSVTYASTRDLEPPINPNLPQPLIAPQAQPENMQLSSSPEHQMVSPIAPITVTVHTNEAHVSPT